MAIPERPSVTREKAQARDARFNRFAFVGLAVLLAVTALAVGQFRSDEAPETLAFADSMDADYDHIREGHAGHDHSNVVEIGHDGEDFAPIKLGGDLPEVIKEHFTLPAGSSVQHVLVHAGDVYEFEGTTADGRGFWKVIDLSRGLIWDAGAEDLAAPFPGDGDAGG